MNEEFEKVDLSDMSTTVDNVMSTSDYAQVIFHDIAESYPIDVNVECKYTVTSLLQPTTRDWVGVYKVGWTSSKEHIYYEWAPFLPEMSKEKQFDSKIVFKAKTLPGDDGEFYQFCYVTSSGQVRGASTPFQFRRPSSDEYVEVEDFDDDIMVIKSKTNALEDELGSVMKEKETLVKNKDRLENERESLLDKLVDKERSLRQEKSEQESLKKQLKANKEKIDQLNAEAKDMLVVHDGLREKIAKLSEEKMSMTKLQEEKEAYTRSLREKVKTLINEKDSIMGKNKMLEEEKDLYKNHFTTSESTLQGHIKEVENLKKQVEKEEKYSSELLENIIELQKEIEAMRTQLAEKDRVCDNYKAQIEDLEELVKSGQEKLVALEECKRSLGRELETITLAYQEVSEKWEECKDEAHSHKEKIAVLEELNEHQTVNMGEQIEQLNNKLKVKTQENQDLCAETEKIKARLGEMSQKQRQEEEGPLFALQMAHECLKVRLQKSDHVKKEMEKDMIELVRRKNAWESREHDMKREIEDLKQRLLMGQEEYKEKYIECKKVYQELKRLQRQSSKVEEQKLQTAVKVEKEIHTQTQQVIEAENHTQTPSIEGSETHTQTPSFEGAEQQTQTRVEETETHTQTAGVVGAEQQTQTSVAEKHTVTQTEMDQQELPELADLTNPELQMQLDDLSKELENRTAKKQKYKEQYQREKEKNTYLQRHYFEQLEKKDEDIEEMKKKIDEKQNQINFLQQTLEWKNLQLEKCRPNCDGQIVYPPQSQVTAPQQTNPNTQHPPPHHNPFIHYPILASGDIPLENTNSPQQGIRYPPQLIPPYPVCFDRQPLYIYGAVPTAACGLPTNGSHSQRQGNNQQENQTHVKVAVDKKPIAATSSKAEITPPEPVSPSVVEELDPLKKEAATAGSVDPPADNEELYLPPPLVPESTPTYKLAKVLSYVNAHRGVNSTVEIPRDECIERDADVDLCVIPECGGAECCTGITFPLQMPPETRVPVTSDVPDLTLTTPAVVTTSPSAPQHLPEEGVVQVHPSVIIYEPEENEERFFDAPELKECPVCNMSFPPNTAEDVLARHIDQHFTATKDCPVCNKKFSSDTDPGIFEEHVQKHFDANPEGTGV